MRLARLLIRRLLAGSLLVLAMMTVAMMALPDDAFERSIARNRTIDDAFKKAAAAIDTYRLHAGRLPAEEDAPRLPGWPRQHEFPLFVSFGDAGVCIDRTGFADAAMGSYVIGAWDGNRVQCYEPRSQRTTLILSRNGFTLFGNATIDRIIGIAFVVLLIVLAWLLWKGRRMESLASDERRAGLPIL